LRSTQLLILVSNAISIDQRSQLFEREQHSDIDLFRDVHFFLCDVFALVDGIIGWHHILEDGRPFFIGKSALYFWHSELTPRMTSRAFW
jgi:hypothetical protein